MAPHVKLAIKMVLSLALLAGVANVSYVAYENHKTLDLLYTYDENTSPYVNAMIQAMNKEAQAQQQTVANPNAK